MSANVKKIAIFSDELTPHKGWHTQVLIQAFSQRGYLASPISLDSCYIDIQTHNVSVYLPQLQALPSLVFVRGVAAGTMQQVITRLNILHTLKRQSVVVYNDAKVIETTVDKNITAQLLAEQGIATPQTWVCEHRQIAHEIIEKALDSATTLVVKPLFGSQGKGVRLIQTEADFLLPKDRYVDGVYYLQEKIDTGKYNYDYRVFVIGDKVIASMKRQGQGWLHNVAQGAKCSTCNETDVVALGLKVTQILNMHYAGVDIIRDKYGQLWVLEVNSIPAWRGLQSVTAVDIAQCLVDDALKYVSFR